MDTKHILLPLLCCSALVAQQFDPANFGLGINMTVGAISGQTMRQLTVGGVFDNPTPSAPLAARWNGIGWSATPPATAVPTTGLGTWATAANGDLLHSDGVAIRRWDAVTSTWTTFPLPPLAVVRAIADFNGDMLVGSQAGGGPGIFRWDPATAGWTVFGAATGQVLTGSVLGMFSRGTSLFAYGSGLAAPSFVGAQLAQWNGTAWSSIPTAATPAPSFLEFATVLAAGDILGMYRTPGLTGQPPYELFRFDGSTWQSIAHSIDQSIHAIVELPDGDLVVGGSFTTFDGSLASGLVRLENGSWSSFARLSDFAIPPSVHALRMLDDNVLAIAGRFRGVNGIAVQGVAGFRASVPGTVTALGSGCIGIGGLNSLTPTTQPLLGRTFSALATGLSSPTDLLVVRSLTSIPGGVPLSTVFPIALPGCNGYVPPDYLEFLPGQVGPTFTLAFAVPVSVALVGTDLTQQLLYFTGNELTSTNGQRITFGRF